MKFFITERGEVAYQLTAARERLNKEMHPGDALLVVTKCISDPELRRFIFEHMPHTIVHATITGLGGSWIEPGVATAQESMQALYDLVTLGFPVNQLVLRIDPIIPTTEGIAWAEWLINSMPKDIIRVRFSFIDSYKNDVSRILPWKSFHAPQDVMESAMTRLRKLAIVKHKVLEACGEPTLLENRGCISDRDYQMLGLPLPLPTYKKQRHGCLCLSTKTELLTKPSKCPNGCRYCYYHLY